MTTTDMTIQTETSTYSTIIETFLPEVNITVSNTRDNDDKLKDIIHNPLELKNLNNNLEEINNDLKNNKNNFFKQTQFIYPMTSSGITTIIIIILIIWIIIQNRKNKPKQTTVRIVDEIDKYQAYGMPRPVLKRNKSTRFKKK